MQHPPADKFPVPPAGVDMSSRARRRDPYPVLHACLSEGRPPTRAEIAKVATRMDREIGAGAGPPWGRSAADARRRLYLAAIAQAALAGRR
jgi:hypothetical protein